MLNENLKLDTLHKFLVVLGVLFFVIPLVMYHYLLSADYGLLISRQDLTNLSDSSRFLFESKGQLYSCALNLYWAVCAFFIIFGLLSFASGICGWRKLQTAEDSNILASLPDGGAVTSSENEDKIKEEYKEEQRSSEKKETAADSIHHNGIIKNAALPKKTIFRDIIERYKTLEACCFTMLKRQLMPDYEIHCKVKISKTPTKIADILACSLKNQPDIMYEIKIGMPSDLFMKKTFSLVRDYCETYHKTTGRECKGHILYIVTVETEEAFKRTIRRLLNEIDSGDLAISYVTEEQLSIYSPEFQPIYISNYRGDLHLPYESNNSMSHESMVRHLQSVGSSIFVKYYFLFRFYDRATCISAMSENYTTRSKLSRISHAKSIIKNGAAIDALKHLRNTEKLSEELIKQVDFILCIEQAALKNAA